MPARAARPGARLIYPALATARGTGPLWERWGGHPLAEPRVLGLAARRAVSFGAFFAIFGPRLTGRSVSWPSALGGRDRGYAGRRRSARWASACEGGRHPPSAGGLAEPFIGNPVIALIIGILLAVYVLFSPLDAARPGQRLAGRSRRIRWTHIAHHRRPSSRPDNPASCHHCKRPTICRIDCTRRLAEIH